MNDQVTLVVPTYNRAHLLHDAIQSTLQQTHPNWEMIIIDDGSTDDTEATVRKYLENDPRIKYFKNPGKGVSAARNHGIQMAQSQYIAFLDDDDISLPHRFESQMKAMKKSGAGFVVSGFQSRDRRNGKLLGEQKLELKATCTGFPSRWMIHKNLLDKAGGFDETITIMEDIELSSRIAVHEIFSQHDDIVAVVFSTVGSASADFTDKKIEGRKLLLLKAQNIFSPLEAAWWQYTLGFDYYFLGEKNKAAECFRKASSGDKRGIYHLAYQYFQLTKRFNGPFKRVNLKVLGLLREFNFPTLVDHPVITTH